VLKCEAHNGDIAAVRVAGAKDAIIRRIYRYDDKTILRPENPTMREQEYTSSDVEISGKVTHALIKLF
jgi:SOS-response transcriptional repressor LexA